MIDQPNWKAEHLFILLEINFCPCVGQLCPISGFKFVCLPMFTFSCLSLSIFFCAVHSFRWISRNWPWTWPKANKFSFLNLSVLRRKLSANKAKALSVAHVVHVHIVRLLPSRLIHPSIQPFLFVWDVSLLTFKARPKFNHFIWA